MKITLNTTSIPEDRRPEVEAIAKSLSQNTQIVWLPSRFPRFVMLVEPGEQDKSRADGGSIFDAPDEGMDSLATMTESLEERIKACLKGPIGAPQTKIGASPAARKPVSSHAKSTAGLGFFD